MCQYYKQYCKAKLVLTFDPLNIVSPWASYMQCRLLALCFRAVNQKSPIIFWKMRIIPKIMLLIILANNVSLKLH